MSRRTRGVSRAIAVVIVALLSLASASALAQSPPDQPQSVLRGWQDGDPIPVGYHRARRVHDQLLLAGAATFAGWYAASVYFAAGQDDQSPFLPVVGPFIAASHIENPSCGSGPCPFVLRGFVTSMYAAVEGALIFDGVAQAAGAVMLALGLTLPKYVLVRDEVGIIKSLRPVPVAASNMGGLGVIAQF